MIMNKKSILLILKNKIFLFVVYAFVGIAIAFLYREICPMTKYKVCGYSMYPTYTDGDIVNVLPYKKEEIERYQIVVASNIYPYGKIVKRVVGLPNEKIEIKEDGAVFVNGKELTDLYGYTNGHLKSNEVYSTSVVLADDEFFLLGDNTLFSKDSRTFGSIKKAQISAVAMSSS